MNSIYSLLITLVLGIISGFIISYLTKDELKQGRKWFQIIIIASIVLGFWFYLSGNTNNSLVCLFILLISLISLVKSKS